MAIKNNKYEGQNMKKITLSMVGILALTVGLSANVPYTFQANTPAKASEVNANFTALSDSVTTLEKSVSDIKSGGASCDEGPFTYTYNLTPSKPGDIININGKDYIIVIHPFFEYGTGDHYAIKYPLLKNLFDYSGMMLEWSTNYVKNDTSCYKYNFSGYPSSNIDITYSTNYSQGNGSDFVITDRTFFYTTIKINKTKLNLLINTYVREEKELSREPYQKGDYDLTDNIDWSKMGVDTSLVDNVQTLFNYVEIIKLP